MTNEEIAAYINLREKELEEAQNNDSGNVTIASYNPYNGLLEISSVGSDKVISYPMNNILDEYDEIQINNTKDGFLRYIESSSLLKPRINSNPMLFYTK